MHPYVADMLSVMSKRRMCYRGESIIYLWGSGVNMLVGTVANHDE